MELRTKALLGLKWSAIMQWGQQGISFVVLIVLARLLGPEAFGLMAIVSVVLALTGVFVNQGFSQAIIQRSSLEPAHLDTAFWITLTLGTTASVTLWILAEPVSALYKEPQLSELIRWLCFLPFLGSLTGTHTALLRREMNFKILAFRRLAASACGAAVGISMAVLGFGIWSLVAQTIADAIIGSFLIWIVTKWRPGFALSLMHFKDLWSFGVYTLGSSLLATVNQRIDAILIGFFLNPTMLGYYSVGRRTTRTAQESLTHAVAQVALPTFSRIQADNSRLRVVFYSATRFVSLVTFPTFSILALLAPEIISVVLGPKWLPAASVLSILTIGSMISSIVWFTDTIILAKGKSGIRLLIGITSTVAGILAVSIAYPLGIAAIASALVLREVLFAPIRFAVAHRLVTLSVREYLVSMRPSIRATAGLILSVLALKPFLAPFSAGTVFLLSSLSGTTAYLLILLIFERSVVRHIRDLIAIAFAKS